MWTWAEDQTAGFRLRRISHDTLVHRLDAELAVGREGPSLGDPLLLAHWLEHSRLEPA